MKGLDLERAEAMARDRHAVSVSAVIPLRDETRAKAPRGKAVPTPMLDKRPCFEVFDTPTHTTEGELRPGVWYFGADRDGNSTKTWICSPLRVDAVTFDGQHNNFGRLLRFRNTLNRWREWAMPMELLAGRGDEIRAELLAMGVEISPSTATRNLLSAYLQQARPERRMHCATQTGWAGESFVLPDKVIGPTAAEVVFQSGERGRARARRVHHGRHP
jgi:putative DNA primase/helicase